MSIKAKDRVYNITLYFSDHSKDYFLAWLNDNTVYDSIIAQLDMFERPVIIFEYQGYNNMVYKHALKHVKYWVDMVEAKE